MFASVSPDVSEALRAIPAALSRFEGLPPSHRSEYLRWIDGAKRPDTRARRIQGMIDRLKAESTHGKA